MCIISRIICSSIFLILCVKGNDVANETVSGPQHSKVVICYWASWSRHRSGDGACQLADLDPKLCTHLIIAFVLLDDINHSPKVLGVWPELAVDENNQNSITKLKNQYPHLKVMVSMGGWQDGSIKYSKLCEDPEKRKQFVNNSVQFLRKHDFDGLDIFWEFPAKRGGSLSDKVNFVHLVKELREEYDKHNFLITAAVGASKDTIDNGYDVPGLSTHLHFMFSMCYDFHGWWSRETGPSSPLYSQDFLNVAFTINHMLKLGADPEKLILGVPSYGRTFLILDPPKPNEAPPRLGGKFKNTTFHGKFSEDDAGSMGYNEICLELVDRNLGWNTYWDWESKTPYSVNGEKMIVYDNGRSLTEKTRFAMDNNLGGIMLWALDLDDFRGDCYEIVDGQKKFPLLRTVDRELNDYNLKKLKYWSKNDIKAHAIQSNLASSLQWNYFMSLISVLLICYYNKS